MTDENAFGKQEKTKRQFAAHRALMAAARNAIAVQDACNLSGVSMSYIEAVKAVNDSATDTTDRNHHPVLVMFLDKMAQLAGIVTNMTGYSATYREVERIATTYPALETLEDVQLFFPKLHMNEACEERVVQMLAFAKEKGITSRLIQALDYAHKWGRSDYVDFRTSFDCGPRSFSVIPRTCKHAGESRVNVGGYRVCQQEDPVLINMGMVYSDNADNEGPGWSFHS
jgi:hypothetical protein